MGCNCNQTVGNKLLTTKTLGKKTKPVVINNPTLRTPQQVEDCLDVCLGRNGKVVCPDMQISNDKVHHMCTVSNQWLDGSVFCKVCLATEQCPKNLWPN